MLRKGTAGKGQGSPRRRCGMIVIQNEAHYRVRAAAGSSLFGATAGVRFRRRRREQAGGDRLGSAEVRHDCEAGCDGEVETDEDDVDCCFHDTKIPH